MYQSRTSLVVGMALLILAGVFMFHKRMNPDETGDAVPASASIQSSSPSGKSYKQERRREEDRIGARSDQYYYPSRGHRTVEDRVHGVLDQNGEITDRAAVYFGLDEEKRSRLNALMKSKFEQESRRISKRAIPVTGNSVDPDVQSDWEIHALKDRGRSFWEGLYRDLPAIVGGSQAEAFVAAMNDREFGGFGRLDGRIQVLSTEGEGQVRVEWFDAVSGSKTVGETVSFRQFDVRYGTAFRIEHAAGFSHQEQ